jgi:hypothetical protein
MKNPKLVAKISITALIVLVLILFLAGVVIPNVVEERPDPQAINTFTADV